MTGPGWYLAGIGAGCLALAAVLALAGPPVAGPVADDSGDVVACSSCDARHARLAETRAALAEGDE